MTRTPVLSPLRVAAPPLQVATPAAWQSRIRDVRLNKMQQK